MIEFNNRQDIVVFWFRRDLRLNDNTGLFKALNSGYKVLPVFIFDNQILEKLPANDRRVPFIYNTLLHLNLELKEYNSSLYILHNDVLTAFDKLAEEFSIKAVYLNNDYEPYARTRDEEVEEALTSTGISFHSFKDQVIFEKNDVLKPSGDPYTVFTPYSRKWTEKYLEFVLPDYKPLSINNLKRQFLSYEAHVFPSLKALGFRDGVFNYPSGKIDIHSIGKYDQTRDFPFIDGTSHLSLHLRFGILSIRELAFTGYKTNMTWLNELQWREFFMQILWHFPHVAKSAFKPPYDRIRWRNNEEEFEKWCLGKTGYPFVDAGMRELRETGFMHNRVRMVTASFLVKHLLIDWRWGEKWFADHLLDFELSSNNGNWQWAAGSGCDAAPYFRIFNPIAQAAKFDPENLYIKRWIPEFATKEYPSPIVDHQMARQRCLNAYSAVKTG